MWDKIISVLGGNLFKGVKEVLNAVIPDATIRAQLEAALDQREQELRLTILKLDVEDRNSARQREMVVKDATPRNLAYAYTLGYFANLYLVWKFGVPADAHDMFLMLEGVLTAAQGAIMNYYFGSSHGSAKKDSLLTNGANK